MPHPVNDSEGPVQDATWEDVDKRLSAGDRLVESFYPVSATSIVQRLHEDGLIFRINREILHPLGISLGVIGRDTDPETRITTVVALLLEVTRDGDAIEYNDEQIARNEAKFARAAERRAAS